MKDIMFFMHTWDNVHFTFKRRKDGRVDIIPGKYHRKDKHTTQTNYQPLSLLFSVKYGDNLESVDLTLFTSHSKTNGKTLRHRRILIQ